MNLISRLRRAFARAAPAGVDAEAFASAVRPATDPKFGDYQANGAMAAAKTLGVNPRELAKVTAEAADLEPFADPPEIAGPGFLNVRIRDAWLADELGRLLADQSLGIEPACAGETAVIDYSSPNVAKPMHVGHVRSTVIGESLARVLEALGAKVIRDNHLGDWGAQFGMILWAYKHHKDSAAFARDPVTELARLYRLAQARIAPGEALESKYQKALRLLEEGRREAAEQLFAKLAEGSQDRFEPTLQRIAEGRECAESCRRETAKLHAGDPENRSLWNEFMPHCLQALRAIYDRLDVHFDVELGESFYDPMLAGVVAELEKQGLAAHSEGAVVVFTDVSKAPFIVRKSDGAYTYATTDLATIIHRERTWRPTLALYVVDHRQSDHFKQLFEVAARMAVSKMRFEHIAFGTVLGPDRRPFKTRDGDTVGLESLLDEAVARARKVVDENSPELAAAEREKVAEIVGLGAIKYADLSQNRLSDYVFDWDRMLAMNGNTGAYLQYAYARIQSIFRKGETSLQEVEASGARIVLSHPAERGLAIRLVRLAETLELAASELKPNVLTDYLFDLACAYSGFFENCPVLKAESDELRSSRLALCALTARTLRFGLGLLAIGVAERM